MVNYSKSVNRIFQEQLLLNGAVGCTSLKYNIKRKDVTSDDVKKWFEETERKEKYKNALEREENLINVYLDIKTRGSDNK